jgi:hypothetical protein
MSATATIPAGTPAHARDEHEPLETVQLLIPGRPQSRLDTESGGAWFALVKHRALVNLEQLGILPLIPSDPLEVAVSLHYSTPTTDSGNIPRIDKLEPTLSALNGILYSSVAQIESLRVQRFIQPPETLAALYGLECRRGLLQLRWNHGSS